MIKHAILIVTLLFHLSSLAYPETIERRDFVRPDGSLPGEERFEKDIAIGLDVGVHVKVEVTAKGNGILHVANLKLKVFKEHDSGHVFDGGLLRVDFVDVTDDGYKDIVISGIIRFTGDNGDTIRSESVVCLYVFDRRENRFIKKYGIGADLSSE